MVASDEDLSRFCPSYLSQHLTYHLFQLLKLCFAWSQDVPYLSQHLYSIIILLTYRANATLPTLPTPTHSTSQAGAPWI
jgi:hypothetical protein